MTSLPDLLRGRRGAHLVVTYDRAPATPSSPPGVSAVAGPFGVVTTTHASPAPNTFASTASSRGGSKCSMTSTSAAAS